MNPLRWMARAFFARIGWIAAGLLLLLFGLDARADPTCPPGQTGKWTVTSCGSAYGSGARCSVGATYSTSASARAGTIVPHDAAAPFSHMAGGDNTTYNGTATSFWVNELVHSAAHSVFADQNVALLSWSCAVATCGVPAGTRLSELMYFSTAGNGTCNANCVTVMQKEMEVPGLGQIYNAYSSGTTCTGGTDIPDVDPDGCVGDTSQCVNNDVDGPSDGLHEDEPSGATWEALEEHGCVTTESGAAFCIASAPDVKRPDTGVPGTVAPPDHTTDYYRDRAAPGDRPNGHTTVNWYSSSTVNNSTNLGSGDPDGDGDDSSGECEPGDTDCEGGGRGDGRVSGTGLGTAKTFGASAGSLWGRVQGSPLASAVSGVAGGMPTGGTCPVLAFTVAYLGTVSTDIHCQIWTSNIAPVLGFVFLAIWGVLGVRILMSA